MFTVAILSTNFLIFTLIGINTPLKGEIISSTQIQRDSDGMVIKADTCPKHKLLYLISNNFIHKKTVRFKLIKLPYSRIEYYLPTQISFYMVIR